MRAPVTPSESALRAGRRTWARTFSRMETPALLRPPARPPDAAAPGASVNARPRGGRPARVLVAGRTPSSAALAAEIARDGRCHVAGVLDDGTRGSDDGAFPHLGRPADALALALALGADTVAIAFSGALPGPVAQALSRAGVRVRPLADVYEHVTGRVAVERVGQGWALAAPFEPAAPSRAHRAAKRALDVAGSLALALTCGLALPLVALAVRLDTPGPVFYTQERVGRGGRRYRVAKFRSMRVGAEDAGPRWAEPSDRRVTRVGRWLRRTHIDELPQALNVLRGEMSLVGPRPERPEFLSALEARIPFYRARLTAKPGLTGWAQVNYGYGRTVEDALVKLQYDLHYLRRPSLLADIGILARTVAVVVRRWRAEG